MFSKNRMFKARARAAFLMFAVLSLAAPGSVAAADAKNAEKTAEKPKAPVVVLQPTEVSLSAQVPGRLAPYRQADVMARVQGIVLERCYKEGQEVKQGEVLFRIDPAPLQADLDVAAASLARAKADYEIAKDKLARNKGLVAARAVSERDYAESLADEKRARANMLYAEAQLKKAGLQLDYATVTSPIAGRARRALVSEGALVGPGSGGQSHLTTVEQMDPIYVDFARSAGEVMELRKALVQGSLESGGGTEVELVLPDGGKYPHKGTLTFSDLSVDPGTDSIVMRATFPNPERVLLPGAYVTVRLNTAINKNAFLVPRDLLLRTPQAAVVMLVSPEGLVEARPVAADILQGRNWVVTAGLSPGDKLIVGGLPMFKPGMAVEAVPVPDQGQSAPAGRAQGAK